jgi:hypothetical protein
LRPLLSGVRYKLPEQQRPVSHTLYDAKYFASSEDISIFNRGIPTRGLVATHGTGNTTTPLSRPAFSPAFFEESHVGHPFIFRITGILHEVCEEPKTKNAE